MAGHVACERRGTFCTVESERSGGGLSGRDAVEESERAKFGGNNRKYSKMWVLAPAPAELGALGDRVTKPGGPGSPAAVSGLCKKCRQTPIFILQVFSHFFSLSPVGAQSRAGGARLALGSSGVALGP